MCAETCLRLICIYTRTTHYTYIRFVRGLPRGCTLGFGGELQRVGGLVINGVATQSRPRAVAINTMRAGIFTLACVSVVSSHRYIRTENGRYSCTIYTCERTNEQATHALHSYTHTLT